MDTSHNEEEGFKTVDRKSMSMMMDEDKKEVVIHMPTPAPDGKDNPKTFEIPKNIQYAPPPEWIGYLDTLSRLGLPEVEITFENLSYTVPVPKTEKALSTLPSEYVRIGRRLGRKIYSWCNPINQLEDIEMAHALEPCSGVIKPGTMTLILGPPGHGKSTMLKALANRLDYPQYRGADSKVLYNGKTAEDNRAQGAYESKLLGYVDQSDVHLAFLTVRETFQFAYDASVVDKKYFGENLPSRSKVDIVLEMLGLQECQNTIVGNALHRGVSGGQKKRTTVGEILMGEYRVLFLDEITTGLDSQSCYQILYSLREWTKRTNGTVVAALLQPTPEVFDLFDNLMLLRMGNLVYHGPIGSDGNAVKGYLQGLGIPVPYDMDLADFLQEFLTDPINVYQRTIDRMKQGRRKRTPSIRQGKRTVHEQVHLPQDLPPLTTEELRKVWYRHELKTEKPAHTDGIKIQGEFSKAQYGQFYAHSFWTLLMLNFKRQNILTYKNGSLIGPRIGQCIFMGLVLGSLYWQIPPDNFSARIGLILFSAIFMAFGNMMEIPIAIESKLVIQKQIGYGFFSILSYLMSVVLIFFPLLCAEAVVLGSIVYWMSGFVPEAAEFFIWLAVLICSALALSTWFRFLAYSSRTEVDAQTKAGPSTAIFLLFGGFLITRKNIRDWLIWVYWFSPFSWAVRSLAQNEFKADRYDTLGPPFVPGGGPTGGPTTGNASDTSTWIRQGDKYLLAWDIQLDSAYIWAGPVLLLGYFVINIALGSWTLPLRLFVPIGSSRVSQDEEEKEWLAAHPSRYLAIGATEQNIVGPSNPAMMYQPSLTSVSSQLTPGGHQVRQLSDSQIPGPGKVVRQISDSVTMEMQPIPKMSDGKDVGRTFSAHHGEDLPFETISLTFKDLEYDVDLPNGKKRKLLRGITAFAKARELTALMGASGAGKTTLMDVLAGRKTKGDIKGEIMVNGKPINWNTFNRLAGYVEQNDLHIPFATVRESLSFSAKLRLPTNITTERREKFVEQVMEDLELTPIADRIIGDAEEGIPGLSHGQLKRVTIGVELVSNPSILFLDEPTSGLDSREAVQVVRVIQKIATKGRTVICTIHQPSAEVFSRFNKLLLLQSGGHQVFFGDIGKNGENLVDYFESFTGRECPETANPATWMLEVLGDKDDSGGREQSKLADEYKLRSGANEKEIERLKTGVLTEDPNRWSYPGIFTQYWELQKRAFTSYWRNIPFNFVRVNLLPLLGILFGLVYYDIQIDDQAGVSSAVASMFMTSAFNGVIHGATALPVIIRERATYYRELASKTYISLPYSIVVGLVEVPYIAILCMGFVVPFYFLARFDLNAGLFFRYYFAHTLLSLIISSWTQFLAFSLPNIMVANIFQGLSFSFMFLFGGIFIRVSSIPDGWIWFYYLNPVPKALRALCLPQFEHKYNLVFDARQNAEVTVRDYVADLVQWDHGTDNYWMWIGYLIMTYVLIRMFISIALRFVNHLKR